MIQSSCFILGFVQRYPTDGGTGLALDATGVGKYEGLLFKAPEDG